MLHRLLSLAVLTALLSSCGEDGSHFKLSGRLMNINQGEFYIYADDGTLDGVDTVKMDGGRFSYEMECREPSTLVMVFPNYSEQPIFAAPDEAVRISGDASHLKELRVKGTRDNELMTDFRHATASAAPPQVKTMAAQLVADHPTSPVGAWLVRKYFVATAQPDVRQARRLVAQMMAAGQKGAAIMRLDRALGTMGSSLPGDRLPLPRLTDDRGRSVPQSTLTRGTTVIVAWASWSYDSMDLLRRVKRWRREAKSPFSVVSVSLDANPESSRNAVRGDSLAWPNVCDGRMFDGAAARQWGLRSVPCVILVKDGRVVARDLTASQLQERLGVK